jgi:Family of unknown function (DUF6221)
MFFRARLAEEEGWADNVLRLEAGNPAAGRHGQWNTYLEGGDDGWAIEDDSGAGGFIVGQRAYAEHIARHDPLQVLSDAEADHNLLLLYERSLTASPSDYKNGFLHALAEAVQFRAARFSTHPDYCGHFHPDDDNTGTR